MNIRFEQVSKQFSNHLAISDLNLTIQDGEFVCLLGPSGCGKTTTLMMLAGLYQPTQGNIYFGNQVVNFLEPKDRNIGMVFQSYALYPHMTVRDNIAFPLKQQKVPKKIRYERAEKTARLVRLENYLDRKPSQLSGGQQQRVALARALVKEPDLLLLDEPMSNLDARLKIEMREELRQLQKQLNITTIMVTHDQEEAMAMADRIAILDRGKIQQFDTPEHLFTNPKNMFVAHFLGNPPMNFLEGQLIQDLDGTVVEGKGYRFHLEKQVNVPNKMDVIIGIRPHDLHVVSEWKGVFSAMVTNVEHLGREKLVSSTIEGHQTIRFFVNHNQLMKFGDRIYLSPNLDAVFLFSKKTGENLLLSKGMTINSLKKKTDALLE
ncbi:ABC transporter ATP-binding protein [Fervidibacillus albus]|uniref:ABC transporter ATP-binding protein n=1 Tax=Fervidibacillus albus TaxID=2980026 RepID=A0A9E8LWT4_9BACI|nr:ABC transporter ATP-binding protein [Fervidibacillus albus]WAA10541.1 ABC transporter ATP-binding protein [Fervidibacillus albus]